MIIIIIYLLIFIDLFDLSAIILLSRTMTLTNILFKQITDNLICSLLIEYCANNELNIVIIVQQNLRKTCVLVYLLQRFFFFCYLNFFFFFFRY